MAKDGAQGGAVNLRSGAEPQGAEASKARFWGYAPHRAQVLRDAAVVYKFDTHVIALQVSRAGVQRGGAKGGGIPAIARAVRRRASPPRDGTQSSHRHLRAHPCECVR